MFIIPLPTILGIIQNFEVNEIQTNCKSYEKSDYKKNLN